MKTHHANLLTAAALLALALGPATPVRADGWGTLTGRFIYDGQAPRPDEIDIRQKDVDAARGKPLFDESLVVDPESRGMANVVVFARSKDMPLHPDLVKPDSDEVVMRIDRLRFTPHVLTMRLDQTLVIENDDPVGHNAVIQPPGETGISPLIPGPSDNRHTFDRSFAVPFPVGCNIHPWMKAYLLPRANPYATVSAADGSFTLEKLPAGAWEFQFWHEMSGFLAARPEWKKGRGTFAIPANDALDLGEIWLTPQLFEWAARKPSP